MADMFTQEELDAALAAADSGPSPEPPGPAAPEVPEVGAVQTVRKAAERAATMGFSDEIKGAARALGLNPEELIQALSAGPAGIGMLAAQGAGQALIQGPEETARIYREARDADRAEQRAAHEANPKTSMATQFAVGAAPALVPGGALAGGIGRAVGTGAATGAATGAGESEAEDLAGQAKDTLIGAGVGALSGGLGHGAGKLIGGALRKFRPKSAAAAAGREVAEQADELAEATGYTQTMRAHAEVGENIEKRVSEEIGEQFRLTPGQKYGSRAAALAERKAKEFPGTMDAAQAGELAQMRQVGKFLDRQVERLAANPAELGRSNVGKSLVETTTALGDRLRSLRSAAATPLYEEAARLAGAGQVFFTRAQRAVADSIDDPTVSAKVSKEVGKFLSKADEAGAVAYGPIKAHRSFWSAVARGDRSLGSKMSPQYQARIARQMLEAIDEDLAETAAGNHMAGEAGKRLREANAVWRAHSQEIDDLMTNSVGRILGVNTDAGDTITSTLLRRSPDEVAGVFRALDRAAKEGVGDPGILQNLRAQMLEDVLVGGGVHGKISRLDPISREAGDVLSPKTVYNTVKKAMPTLRAAFAGDPKAQLALSESQFLLKRVSFGPNIQGSDTAPLLAQAATETAEALTGKAGGAAGSALGRLMRRVLGSEKALANALSAPEGIDAFNTAARGLIGGKRAPSEKAALAAMSVLTRLGVEAAVAEPARAQHRLGDQPE